MVRYSLKHKRLYNDDYYYKNHDYKGKSRRNFYINRTSSEDPLYSLDKRIKYINRLQKSIERNDRHSNYDICESGYTKGQGWGGLHRSWLGFILNTKKTGDMEKIEHYALGVQKIEKDMGLDINQFPELQLAALEYMQDDNNYDVLQEKADKLRKPVDELSSQDILSIMIERDRKAYEELKSKN